MDLEHERRLTEVEARSKSNTKRLDDLEKRQDDLEALSTSVAKLAEREARMETDVQEIKADVKLLTGKPGKKWENMEEKVIWAIVAAAIGYFMAQIGVV